MPSLTTDSPAFSKVKSAPSAVLQASPMFATAISGSWSNPLPEPPETLMGAQFMYISRLPTLLNQVQAMVSWPSGSASGTLNPYVPRGPLLPEPVVGQPPSIEWMTFHFESLVGFESLETEIWQDPPPWVAVWSEGNETLTSEPTAQSFIVVIS